jgi:hypothetical protein
MENYTYEKEVREAREEGEIKELTTKDEAIQGLKKGMTYFAEHEGFDVAKNIKSIIGLVEADVFDPNTRKADLFAKIFSGMMDCTSCSDSENCESKAKV